MEVRSQKFSRGLTRSSLQSLIQPQTSLCAPILKHTTVSQIGVLMHDSNTQPFCSQLILRVSCGALLAGLHG